MANGKGSSAKKDSSKGKKRRIIESSDDEDDNQQKNKKPTLASKVAKLAPTEKKLKPVSVSSVFGDGPIKRIEKERKPPKKASEKGLLDNEDDDVDLMEIDEALLSPKSFKVEAKPSPKKEKSSEKLPKSKSKEKLETKSPAKDHHRSHSSNNNKSPSVKIEKASPVKDTKHSSSASKGHKRSDSNRSNTDSDDKESHKRKKNGGETPSSSKKPPKRETSPSENLDSSGLFIFEFVISFWKVFVNPFILLQKNYSLRSGPGTSRTQTCGRNVVSEIPEACRTIEPWQQRDSKGYSDVLVWHDICDHRCLGIDGER